MLKNSSFFFFFSFHGFDNSFENSSFKSLLLHQLYPVFFSNLNIGEVLIVLISKSRRYRIFCLHNFSLIDISTKLILFASNLVHKYFHEDLPVKL